MLALSLLFFLALYLVRGAGKSRKYPPVAGTMLHQLFNFGRLVEYQTELARRHRTFRMLTPTCNYVYTVEPANVEYMLKINFANYGKGVMTHDVLEDLLGDGIFNVDGAKWRHQRKVASHEFSTRVLREFSSAVFRDTAAELAGIVVAAAADATPVILPTSISDNYLLRPESLASVISRILILCSPSNSKGSLYSKELLEEIAAIVRKYPRLLYTLGASSISQKAGLAALNLGYACGEAVSTMVKAFQEHPDYLVRSFRELPGGKMDP